ncbi:MAG: integrase arm-type DNA-binding domain-containing protein, partial [Synergistaceae bacterium]|nr:integrase arm-type DNA-binding domain-containing protein [Synergistaceae bacterium]
MLNETQIKNSKPKIKKYLLNDSNGLYLRIDPSGRKYWLMRFKESGKSHEISFGVYPDVSLNEARFKRDELQTRRKNGELISLRPDKMPVNFQEASKDWLKIRMKNKSPNYLKSIHLRLEKYILPAIGEMKLSDIKAPIVLNLCRKIENKEFIETAHRIRGLIGQIFRFSIASGYCENDPTQA